MNADPSLVWGARIFLILILVFSVIYILRNRKIKYEYQGISDPINFVKNVGHNFVKKGLKTSKKQKQHTRRPRCNKTEEECRKIMQKIYRKPFPTVRPDFLRSPVTKKKLELDCYNKDLQIALEYNGQQHYNYTPHFHRSKKNFYSQVHRDDWKRRKCRELGIRLIEIPYWIAPINLEEYIKKELRKQNCL